MNSHDSAAYPKNRRRSARFRLGQNRFGRWVLRDAEGYGYAIFATDEAAIAYALEESGGARDAVLRSPDGLESRFASGSDWA